VPVRLLLRPGNAAEQGAFWLFDVLWSRVMGKPAMLAASSAIALFVAVNAAAAQSCGDEVQHLAQQYNLSTGTPREGASETSPAPTGSSGAGGTTAAERAARAEGVMAPPDAGATAVIQPPTAAPEKPPAAPETVRPPDSAGDPGGLGAHDRTRMESLLQQALAAERQGKLTECLDLLRKAAALPGLPGAK